MEQESEEGRGRQRSPFLRRPRPRQGVVSLHLRHEKRMSFLTNTLSMVYWAPEIMFAKCDKHYPSRSRQTSLATALTNFTKSIT